MARECITFQAPFQDVRKEEVRIWTPLGTRTRSASGTAVVEGGVDRAKRESNAPPGLVMIGVAGMDLH